MTKAIKFMQGDMLHVAHSRHMDSFLNCPSKHSPVLYYLYSVHILYVENCKAFILAGTGLCWKGCCKRKDVWVYVIEIVRVAWYYTQ